MNDLGKKSRFAAAVRRFHEDERGLEAVQVVMILAIAAVALLVIKAKWSDIKEFFNTNADEATNWD